MPMIRPPVAPTASAWMPVDAAIHPSRLMASNKNPTGIQA